MNIESLLIFISISLIAVITPGPAILLVSTNSIKYGLQKTIATILGNITGLFIMSLLAVLGLTTIILTSATIFVILKLIGAFYLIFLGVKLWKNGFNAPIQNHHLEQSIITPKLHRLYAQGLLIALSNPKAIAFTTALLPQFINTDSALAPQFLTLILIFMSLSFSCLFGYGVLAVRAQHRTKNITTHNFLGKLFGSAFIGSGVLLAFTNQK